MSLCYQEIQSVTRKCSCAASYFKLPSKTIIAIDGSLNKDFKFLLIIASQFYKTMIKQTQIEIVFGSARERFLCWNFQIVDFSRN